jgi:hypothetical protein
MKSYIARITLITLVGVSLMFTAFSTYPRARSQQQERIVVRKPWPVEPVRVVAFKTKNRENKENLETRRAFEEDDDWLDGFTITIANNYDKTVTALTIALVFRREPDDSRPPFAYNVRFGPSPNIREYLNRDPSKVIKVGNTLDLQLSSDTYQLIKRTLDRLGYPSNVKRVELVIREVGFEDGSMIHTGTLYLQDPNHPNDPTKKIPGATAPCSRTKA